MKRIAAGHGPEHQLHLGCLSKDHVWLLQMTCRHDLCPYKAPIQGCTASPDKAPYRFLEHIVDSANSKAYAVLAQRAKTALLLPAELLQHVPAAAIADLALTYNKVL